MIILNFSKKKNALNALAVTVFFFQSDSDIFMKEFYSLRFPLIK